LLFAWNAWYNFVSPEFFPALEIPILRGRNFTRDEAAAGAPVAVVSLATARLFWPNRDAVGQSIRTVRDPQDHTQSRVLRHESVRVIGIARDIAVAAITLSIGLRFRHRPTKLNTQQAGLAGRSATALGFHGREGRVRVGDSDWAARVPTDVPEPQAGARLRIEGVDGTVLIVRPEG